MPAALLAAIAVIFGAAIGLHLHLAAWLWLTGLVACLSAAAVSFTRGRGDAVLLATLIGFACGAAALADRARERALYTPLRQVLDAKFGGFSIDTLAVEGDHPPLLTRLHVEEDAARSDQVVAIRARARSLRVGGQWIAVDGGVTVSIGGTLSDTQVEQWRRGRTIEAPLTFRRPARYLNDGVPDGERELAFAGTTLFASVKSGLLVSVAARGGAFDEWCADVRRHTRRAVGRAVGGYSPLAAAIVNAILIGDRTGLPDEIRLRLQAAGTYHVIAISGGNIAILATLTAAVLMLTGASSRPVAAGVLMVLVVYAAIVTAGPSVWRATLMAAIYLTARLLDHRTAPWQAIGVSSIVLVATEPLDVRDAGFVLTFGATAALLDVAARSQWLRLLSAPARLVLAGLVSSAWVELALLPVAAELFSRITAAGIFLNLVAIPAMAVTQVAGMLVAMPLPAPGLQEVAGWAAHIGADLLVSSARLVEVAPWLARRVPPPPWWVVALYYAGWFGVRLRTVATRCVAGTAWILAAAMIVSGTTSLPHLRPVNQLRLTMFDVGQGDAMLLEAPGGPAVMIDSGGMPFGGGGFDVGARVLEPAVWSRGVYSLDALLLTHGDPDHVGGAPALLSDFTVRELWEGVPVPRHAALQQLHSLARQSGVTPRPLRAGQQQPLGAATIRVLNPPEPDWERPRVRNDDSVVLEVRYGDVALLLTGDIGADVERQILPQLSPARIRILKVAHHGSRTSSSSELLDRWRPQIALISCGRGNRFGHPAPEVVARLRDSGARLYRTDRDGEITLSTDGSSVTVTTFLAERDAKKSGARTPVTIRN